MILTLPVISQQTHLLPPKLVNVNEQDVNPCQHLEHGASKKKMDMISTVKPPSLKKRIALAILLPVLLLSLIISSLYLSHRLSASASLALLQVQASLQTTAALLQQHVQSARNLTNSSTESQTQSSKTISQEQKNIFRGNLRATLNQAMSNPLIRSAALIYHPKEGEIEEKTVIHTGPPMLPISQEYGSDVAKTKKLFSQQSSHYPQQVLRLSDKTFRLTTPIFPRPGAHPDLSLSFEIDPTQLVAERYEIIAETLAAIFFSLLVGLLSGLLLYRFLRAPLKSLNYRVNLLAQGQWSFQANPQAFSELADVEKCLEETVLAITQAREELEQSANQATEDLRQTLDTIEIQNIELDLARKEALEASRIKSEFLANMSHEIRTPLNGIMGFTKLLLKSPLAYKHREYLDTIHKSADGLLTIINDILDFSKIEAGKLALEHISFNLSAIIEEALTMVSPLAHEKHLELINLFFAQPNLEVLGDPLRIKQVITNLVNNAIKFTDHGCITVRTSTESTSEQCAVFKVCVTDTGIGLTDTEQNNLFKAFSQGDASSARKYGGTGLGLVICKHLVRQMGGEIGFHSEHQTGSTFWFTLNLTLNRNARFSEDEEPCLKGKRVLVFDANPLVRLSLRNILEHWHMGVEEVDALDEIFPKLSQTDNDHIDTLILGKPQQELTASELSDLVSLIKEQYTRQCLVLCDTHQLYQWQNQLPLEPEQILSKPVAKPKLQSSLMFLLGETNPYHEETDHLNANPSAKKVALMNAKKTSVLCVDDNHSNLTLIRALLEDLGVEVTTCDNGFKALEVVGQKDFDIIFMDIQMPRMDGVVTTRKIRALESSGRTPIIALTAHALPSEKQNLLKSGMDEYITKPVNEKQLIQILERYTGYKHETSHHETSAIAKQKALTVPTAKPQDQAQVPRKRTTKHQVTQPLKIFDKQEHLSLSNNKANLADELLDMLIDSLPEARYQMVRAWEAENYEVLLEHTHKLHGATRYCGVPALRHALSILETNLKQNQTPALPKAMKQTLIQIDQLQQLHEKAQAQPI